MASRPAADPRLADADIRWFRARVPITDPQWRVLEYRARRRAFWVAGVTQAQVVLHVWRAIDDSLRRGLTFREFRANVLQSLASQWGTEIPGRIETIFRTNLQHAYQAGRWWQMNDPEIRKVRSWWLYDAVLDSRTTEVCRSRHGVALPASDPWWRSNYPPLHYNCRSGVRALTEDEVVEGEYLIGPEVGTPPAPEGWGLDPTAAEWTPDLSQYPPEIAAALRQKLAEAGLAPRRRQTREITEEDLSRLARSIADDWADAHGAAPRVRNVTAGRTWPDAMALYEPQTGQIVLDKEHVMAVIQALASKEQFLEWMRRSELAAELESLLSMKFGPRWRDRPWREVRVWLLRTSPDISGAIRTYAHEIAHGVAHPASDWSRYRQNNVYGALQEAVTEIWAQLNWRAVAQRLLGTPAGELPEVDIWTANLEDIMVPVRWSYRGAVVALRELLKLAGMTREEFFEAVRHLKFKVPMQDRPEWLMRKLLEASPEAVRDPDRAERIRRAIFRMTTADSTVRVVSEVRDVVQGS